MIGKLNNLVNKYGAKGSARLIARYLRDSILARLGPRGRESARTEALLAEIRAGSYERIILRRGSFGWHTPLFQRAQQLSRALGRRGCLILYEAAPPHDLIRGAQKLGEGLWLVNFRCPRLRRRIESAAAETGRPRYVMIASPESRLPLRVPKRYAAAGWRVIYDYIDAISGEIGGVRRVPKRCRALYEWAMGRGDVIVTASALALRRDAESRGKTAFLVENGVDCAHFSSPAPARRTRASARCWNRSRRSSAFTARWRAGWITRRCGASPRTGAFGCCSSA